MERVDLARERHAERQRWRNGAEWDAGTAFVAVGELDGGRWYVRRYGHAGRWPDRGPRAYPAEHYAQATARRWMRTVGGTWVEA